MKRRNAELAAAQRRKWTIICILILVIAAVTGGTLAYFWDDDNVRTMFATGEYDSIKVQLIEPEWKSADQGLDSMPGDNIPADPTIRNIEQDVYMRVKVYLTDRESGAVITGTRARKIASMIRYASAEAEWNAVKAPMKEAEVDGYLPLRYNEDEFVYDTVYSDVDAGVYYFNYIGGSAGNPYIFKTGHSAVLYTHVIVPLDWTEEDLAEIGTFRVNITGQAIHAENYDEREESPISSPEEAFRLIEELVDEAE